MKRSLTDRPGAGAFTLIELLVVVAIIAVLIAILLPSMSRARYVAELTVCGTRLNQIGVGATAYAAGNRTAYPYRAGAHNNTWYKPNNIAWSGADDRPLIREYIDLNGLLNCPLNAGEIDADVETDTAVFVSYHLFFGWGYQTGGEQWMNRMGDEMTFQGNRFRVLASDRMVRVGDGRGDHGTHASRASGQAAYKTQSAPGGGLFWTEARWIGDYATDIPGMDLNFLYTDGSVQLMTDLLPYDERVVAIPEFTTTWEYPTVATFLPPN